MSNDPISRPDVWKAGREWKTLCDGKTLAARAHEAQHAEGELDDMLFDAFGELTSWDEDGPSFTTDYYDNSIEVYAPEIEATPHALAVLTEAGFRLAWIHPHIREERRTAAGHCKCPAHSLSGGAS